MTEAEIISWHKGPANKPVLTNVRVNVGNGVCGQYGETGGIDRAPNDMRTVQRHDSAVGQGSTISTQSGLSALNQAGRPSGSAGKNAYSKYSKYCDDERSIDSDYKTLRAIFEGNIPDAILDKPDQTFPRMPPSNQVIRAGSRSSKAASPWSQMGCKPHADCGTTSKDQAQQLQFRGEHPGRSVGEGFQHGSHNTQPPDVPKRKTRRWLCCF